MGGNFAQLSVDCIEHRSDCNLMFTMLKRFFRGGRPAAQRPDACRSVGELDPDDDLGCGFQGTSGGAFAEMVTTVNLNSGWGERRSKKADFRVLKAHPRVGMAFEDLHGACNSFMSPG